MLHRHIIIEGPDGSGKTTLARRLADATGYAYAHEGPPPRGVPALEHYGRLLAKAKSPTVFDRLHLGEQVYGPLLRGRSGLGQSDLVRLTRLVTGTGTPIVFCCPPWHHCQQNCEGRDEFIKDDAVRRAAYDRWQLIIREYPENVQCYDYTEDRFLMKQYPRLPDGVVGAPDARLLLVGEQPNGTLDLPFFGSKSSSTFLHDCMVKAGINEWDVALTNALDAYGNPRNLNTVRMGMPKLNTIVALGRVAEHAVRQMNDWPRTLRIIEHPQYWLRFKHARLEEYVLKLQAAYQMSW